MFNSLSAAKISKRRNRQKCTIGRQKCPVGRPSLCGCTQNAHLSFPEKGFPFLGHPTKRNGPEKHLSFQICMKNEKIESILKMMTPQSVLSVSEEQ